MQPFPQQSGGPETNLAAATAFFFMLRSNFPPKLEIVHPDDAFSDPVTLIGCSCVLEHFKAVTCIEYIVAHEGAGT